MNAIYSLISIAMLLGLLMLWWRPEDATRQAKQAARLWWIFRATVFAGHVLRDWPWSRRWEIASSVHDDTDDEWLEGPADQMSEEFSCWQE